MKSASQADAEESATSTANPCLAPLATLHLQFPIAVAYSGGADSTALLLAACERWPGQVHALHVHHGLQAAAEDFVSHCQSLCARHRMPLHVSRVDARHRPGESPEDAARQARYAALGALAKDHGLQSVLLGQHADDQAETMLIALGRGAGLAGLAAMPTEFEREGVHFVRPLLRVRGGSIRQWLTEHGHIVVEDPTNADTRLTRNRVRHELLPALEKTFPQFRDTFARSARHAAQANALLAELAALDLAQLGGEPVIRGLQALSRSRQSNVLRHWLRLTHGVTPSTAQLEELLNQITNCTTRGHAIRIKVATGFVLRDRIRLIYAAGPVAPAVSHRR